MKIVYTVQARQDLRSIYEYLAYTLQVPDTAGRMAERIMDGVRSLKSMPERNPLYQDEPWRSQGVRFLPVKKYLVFYTVDSAEKTVFVIRILYSGRDIRCQLEEMAE